MRYAKIEAGKVVQTQPNAGAGFIQCRDSIIVGMLFDGDLYSNPVIPLAASQSYRRSELRVNCEAAITGLFSSSALGSVHSYDNRRDDQSNLRLRQTVSALDTLPRNTWAHDGVEFTRKSHTTAQLDQVMIDMEAHIETQQAKLAGLIAQVNAVNTGDDTADAITIAAIVW